MMALLPSRLFITHGPRKSGSVCLTFDDGPHPVHTPRILDALKDNRIKATFFILGRNAQEHTELVRRMVQEGHALGYHSFTHTHPSKTPVSQVIDENKQTDDVLRGITAPKVAMTRPPYGKLTIAQLVAMWRAKLTVVLWNRDPKDFTAATSEELRRGCCRSGSKAGTLSCFMTRRGRRRNCCRN